MTSVPCALDRRFLIDGDVAGGESGALPQATREYWFGQHKTRDHDTFALTMREASGCKERYPYAAGAGLLDLGDTFCEHICHACRVDQFCEVHSASQNPHRGGNGQRGPCAAGNNVNARFARGGSLAGTVCDAVSDSEARLARLGGQVFSHLFSLAPIRTAREPIASDGEQTEPVTALRRIVGDSTHHAKTGERA